MKQILYILLIGIVITSCKKHKEERTEYLTQDQKDIIDAFKVGDTFTMQKTEIDDGITFIDTITFKVSRAGYGVASNGRWYENGGPETWTERGVVEFKAINTTLIYLGDINVSGDSPNSISMYIGSTINTSQYIRLGDKNINGTSYSNVFLGFSSINDSIYFSIKEGIIKAWDNEESYIKIN